ncbi:hypothetical protein L2E82_44305 [Cichorium intybus]|uniref:Uncharacterized protein n=1 Tax=Cichorium intybus TaxID=13427 RepID=A0ACB8ZQ52_CICIN|nr:hypothetical protein L2E82_44305 [Cichorium intybus]
MCCYAFGVADTIESLHAIQTQQLVELSPKEILDCSNCAGCDGGRPNEAFQYVIDNNGITTEKNYPYKPVKETCNVKKENDIVVKIGGYEQMPANNEQAAMVTVANQPVEFGIAVEPSLKLYKEGIFTEPCGLQIAHSVIAVGYDTAPDGTQYWILKNSWGTRWGESGYIKMPRGRPEKEGYCGMYQSSFFPLTEKCSTEHAPSADKVVKSTKDL